MKQYKIHPLAEKLPMMPEEELAELSDDIKENGQREDCVLLDNQILDGRGRCVACERVGVKPRCRKYDRSRDGNDPVAFVLTHNVYRRHLTIQQRAMALAELRKHQKTSGKRISPPNGGETPGRPKEQTSIKNTAAQGSIPERTMERAAVVVDHAPKEVIDAVNAGDVSLSDAAAVATLPKAEQKAALKEVKGGKAKTLKAAATPKQPKPVKSGTQKTDVRVFQQWDDLFGKLKRASDRLNDDGRGGKFCRDLHESLNAAYEIRKEWWRAVK